LAEIEAIVSEIEREKEAGWCMTRQPLLITESISLLQRLKENALGWLQPQQGRLLWLNGQENDQLWIVMYKFCYKRGRNRMLLFLLPNILECSSFLWGIYVTVYIGKER
jgi:hypothetical protein